MGAINANLQVTAGQLPAGVCYDHDENSRLQAYAARLLVSLDAAFATFQYGDVAPTSDLGPWFNTTDNNWWVWDNTVAAYIPLEPAAVTGQVPVGTVLNWAGTIAAIPTFFNALGGEWNFCNGVAISRTTYSLLFGIIGTQYGVGDGVSTFNIPDCRDQMVAGANADDTGTAKTLISDGAALTKSRAYIDHWHQAAAADGLDVISGGSNRSVGGALGPKPSGAALRVLPPYISLAYVIRVK